MANIFLKNDFLNETSLTSTVNKYLSHSDFTSCYNSFLIKESQRTHQNILISTKNEYLEEYSSVPAHEVLKRKKCRKKLYNVYDRSRSPSRNKRFRKCMPKVKACSQFKSSKNYASVPFEDDVLDSSTTCDLTSNVVEHPTFDSPVIFGEVNLSHIPLPRAPASNMQSLNFNPPGATSSSFQGFGGRPSASFCFGGGILRNQYFKQQQVPVRCKDILEMPVYNFELEDIGMESCGSFDYFNKEFNNIEARRLNCMKSKKMQLLSAVSMALMCSANLKDEADSYRKFLQNIADNVRPIDPEFVLKVALYARQELNIRSVSNYLLSYAAYYEGTRHFLEKYFEMSIRLPSDWIEVADLYQTFKDTNLKPRSLPSALRKVMKNSFKKFDEYQLAKYKKCKKTQNKTQSKGYTLKQLIRLLHIDSPVKEVMSLLGKKYPETAEAFKKSGLSGIWDSRLVGKKMKLTQPLTWEILISSKGNKPNVWEELIDANKLPYMATLRNLRNLILSGISLKHHEKVLEQLQNKYAVINSRQLPLQFFEAYKVVSDLENLFIRDEKEESSKSYTAIWKNKHVVKLHERIHNASPSILSSYKASVNKALEISALHNLPPIPGKTLVICDLLFAQTKELNSLEEKTVTACFIMGTMCLKACEYCKMYAIHGTFSDEISLNEDDDLLQALINKYENLQRMFWTQTMVSSSILGLKKVLEFYLMQKTILSDKINHIIFLRTSSPQDKNDENFMSSFLNKYRQIVNPDLLYTNVNFSFSCKSFSDIQSSDGKDIYLSGNSAQLIKYISERANNSQLICVENIDVKYDLKSARNQPFQKCCSTSNEKYVFSPYSRAPKWASIRIFISSTFKDMHSERDLLVRYVIPELRKRAASIFMKIHEVDLRWGITEAECSTKRAAELCLMQAQRSDVFIGILGERYGSIYNFETPDAAELQWVKNYPELLSITELEMYAGALKKEQKKKGFFYLRNNSFINEVPEIYKEYFTSENSESKIKVDKLKSKIKKSGTKVLDGYTCHFAGVFKGKPILSELDCFGKTVLEDLWSYISDFHKKDPYLDTISEEEEYQQNMLNNFDHFIGERNVIVENVATKIKKEYGVFLISGTSGSGKTAFLANLLDKLKNFTVIKFFIGLSPRSTDIAYILQFLSESIVRKLPISTIFPKLPNDIKNNFPDILQEAVNIEKDFILLIDGLDKLDSNAQALDWLPYSFPDKLRLVCSASDSSYAFKVLYGRQAKISLHIETLIALPQLERVSIVKHYLELYGKTLDESSFNNQMLHMVTKKDSGIPLYLRIACDFFRNYASFENFMAMLQSLPTTISLILQEVILQMENEYGAILVQAAFTLLCITKEGLDDRDLHLLLSIHLMDSDSQSFGDVVLKIESFVPDLLLSQVTFFSLLNLICTFGFGNIRSSNLNLLGSELEKVVKKFYLNKNLAQFEKRMHMLLAAYYHTICDPGNCGTFQIHSGHAFRGLLYHMYYGNCYKELAGLLCNLKFLEACFREDLGESLLEYFTYLLEITKQKGDKNEVNLAVLKSHKNFVLRNMHILQKYPELTAQQALNEPLQSLVKSEESKPYMIECLLQPQSDHRLSTLSGFLRPITAVACQERSKHAILGSEDGYLKILDFSSKKVIRNMKSHTSAITFICFGGKNRICTASNDTMLNIWSSDDYSLISVLKGHRRNVTCCCTDPSGAILFSSGWDNSVRLWSLHDGRSISVIENFRCPVNCIDHHPMKQQFVSGLWNGRIEIWDSVSLKKLISTSSHCGSVKSIAYTPDGINIISAFINCDITIWSAEEGLKLSNLKGHVLPVKSIAVSYEKNMIISGSEDCTLKVWPIDTGIIVTTISSCKFCTISILEAISHDVAVVIFQNSEIWVLNMHTGHVISKLTFQLDTITRIGKMDSKSYRMENIKQPWIEISVVLGTQCGQILIGNFVTSSIAAIGQMKSRVTSIVYNAYAIVCGNSDGDIGVFSYPDFNSTFVYGAHRGSVMHLNLYVDLSCLMLMSSGNEKVVKFWKVATKEEFKIEHHKDHLSRHNDGITCCCYVHPSNNENQKWLLTGSHDNTVILAKEDKHFILTGLKSSVVNVGFMGNYIVGCANDGSIAMWSWEGKICSYIPGIEQSSAVLSFFVEKDAASMLDMTLIFVDRNGTVKVSKPVQKVHRYSLEGHSQSITSCCINSNEEILSSSVDGTLNFWRVNVDTPDTFLHHKSSINGILFSVSHQALISSDVLGNVILWKMGKMSKYSSLTCVAKRTYTGGFIKCMTWMTNSTFITAVTQILDRKEKHFIDIIKFECSQNDDQDVYNLQVIHSRVFESEILCLDVCLETETIVTSLKSGEIAIITSNLQKIFKPSDEWVVGVKALVCESLEYLFISLLDGNIKCFLLSKLLEDKVDYEVYLSNIQFYDASLYTSTFYCESKEIIFSGDTEGRIKVHKDNYICKKIHESTITGIVVIGLYVFTSSLDKTVKGWISTDLKQVCQFHSSVPITFLAGSPENSALIIGTLSGGIQLLKFHPL